MACSRLITSRILTEYGGHLKADYFIVIIVVYSSKFKPVKAKLLLAKAMLDLLHSQSKVFSISSYLKFPILPKNTAKRHLIVL